jgi:tetraacyldisaccharide 4'-kinase
VNLAGLWYDSHPLSILLAPLGWLFSLAAAARRYAYRAGLLRSEKMPVPVIVVGNITVGGTGKTPLVIYVAEALRQAGHRPGVVSRGYGGRAATWPQTVTADSDPVMVGDEPVLIARRAGCPVAVAPRRAAAVGRLLAEYDCDVIVCDDGLQHYPLARDIEIAVVDGARRLGNGRCLPAGPLREPPARLRTVDLVVVNGGDSSDRCVMHLTGNMAFPVRDSNGACELGEWRGSTVHGVAGIGNPERFFVHLRSHGLNVVEHPFPDHHRFDSADLRFGDELPVIMTEKDAIKCRSFAHPRLWYVPVDARLDAACEQQLRQLLARVMQQGAAK